MVKSFMLPFIIGIVVGSIGCKYSAQDDGQYFNEVIRWLSIVGVCSLLINGKTLKIIFYSLNHKLDLRSTMSSPRTGILALIRLSSGQDKDV